MNALCELVDIIRFDIFGPTKTSIFDFDAISNSWAMVMLFILALILSFPFHLLAPFWIFIFFVFPYSSSWLLYFIYAQTKRKSLLPVLPISPLQVYKVNKAFFYSFSRLIQSPIKSIFIKNFWKKPVSNLNSNERFLLLQDLDFGSKVQSKLDIYYLGDPIDPVQIRNGVVKPVLIFVHGGAWSNGNKRIYRIMAQFLVESGYLVVIPDYIKFPRGSGTEMIHDVTKSIYWTIQNIRLYGGDPSNITVIGHGAGAHLTTVSLIWNATKACEYEEFNREAGFSQPDIYPTQDIIARDSSAPPFFKLAGVVLMGGIYNLEEQLEFEKLRGVEHISCLERLFGYSATERDEFSPYALMAKALTSISSNTLIHHLPQSWLFLHHEQDELVPYKQCFDFFDQVEETGILNISMKSYTSSDHCEVLYDLFLGETDNFCSELKLLQERQDHIARYKRWLASEHRKPSRSSFRDYRGVIGQRQYSQLAPSLINKHQKPTIESSISLRKRSETLDWLGKALGLNPIHFISQHFGASTYDGNNTLYRKSSPKLEIYPMDSLSKPYPVALVRRGQKRLRRINGWGKDEYKLYSIMMIGRLGKNDCLSLLQKMSVDKIPFETTSLDFWEAIIQSVILKGNDSRGAKEIYRLAENYQSVLSNPHFEGSMKIQLAFALGALYEDDLAEFTTLFRELRKKWWPLSRAAYTQIIAAHCDYLYRFGRPERNCTGSKKIISTYEDNRLSPTLQGIRSLRWVLKHMHLSGVALDSYQYHLLIIGFCRANLSQKALRLYHWFIRKGGIPQPQLLDVFLDCICRFPAKKLVKTHQFGLETNAATLIDYFMDHYTQYQLTPSLHSYLLVISFFSKVNPKKASKYYQQVRQFYTGECGLTLCARSYSSLYSFEIRKKSRTELWKILEPSNVWIEIVKSWKTFEYMKSCEELGVKYPRLNWIVPDSADL